MPESEYVVLLTVVGILAGAVVAGPVFGIPADGSGGGCSGDGPIGTGQASVAVTELPESAVIERTRFGTNKWAFSIAPAAVEIGPVSGRPTVTYKVRIDSNDVSLAAGSTAILSRCQDTTRLVIQDTQFQPRTLDQDTYPGTITVTYRGTRGGEDVTHELARKNITVEVDR